MKGNEMDAQVILSEKRMKSLKCKAERTVKEQDGEYDFDTGKDGYDLGFDDGETYLAREILKELGIEYEVPPNS